MEFRVGVGVRGQESGVRGQESVVGVRGCPKNLTPKVGKRPPLPLRLMLRAFQPINM